MLLAVDVGNTNIVFAIFDGDVMRTRWRIATDPRRTGDEYAVWLIQLMQIEGIAREDVTGMIVSSVVPRARHNLEVLASKYFNVEPLFAGEGKAAWNIAIDVEEPRSLGADRAVNAIAAHAKYPGDLIVIDFGTATTIDHVDASGAYRGGIIAPGINLSLDALVNNTAKLPRIAIEAPRDENVIGRNTEDQMLIGVYWGYVAMLEGLIARMKAQIGSPDPQAITVIATGGLAVVFDKHTSIFNVVDGDLTLQGLAMIAQAAGAA
jgi:type III pantothenate kinase